MVALKPGSRFGHKIRGVDTAVLQATSIWEMSLKFLPLSPVEVKKKLFNFVIRFIIYCFVGCKLDNKQLQIIDNRQRYLKCGSGVCVCVGGEASLFTALNPWKRAEFWKGQSAKMSASQISV